MMVVGLLLAQLVLPGPPSGPIQPPGMICLGECAGPVVWGPAERGRLVVACDMTSDTCSDGRKITTTRATPVPCEVAPGVWEIIPADQGCYSVRGLESWAATTSYLAWGAELDREVWIKQTGITVTAVPGGYVRVGRSRQDAAAAFVYQELAAITESETWTAACIMRAGTARAARLSVYRSAAASTVALTDQWATYTITRTLNAGQVPGVSVGPPFAEGESYIEIAGCWLTRTATPGRPCWGGEAPVTCAADRNTVSTEGWPTASGEILVGVRLEGDASENRVIIDGGEGATFRMAIQTNNAIRLSWDGLNPTTAVLPWEYGRTYVLKLVFAGTTISLYRDGVFLRDFAYSRPVEWAPDVRLGTTGTAWLLNGAISYLRVRSFE